VPVSREPRAGWATADLRDASAVAGLPPFDAVVHCAALTPRSGELDRAAYESANVETTRVLAAEAARRRVQRFVFVSTMGRPEQQDDRPGEYYVASKREAERRLTEDGAGRFAVWILRAASLYGEYDRGSMATLIGAVARGRFIAIGDLRHRKCLLYAGSLGAIIASEIETGASVGLRTEAVHDLEVHRFSDVLSAVERAVGRRAARLPVPAAIARAGLRAGRATADVAGMHRAARVLGAASVALRDVPCDGDNALERAKGHAVELDEGVRREVAWLRSDGRI
ncbi:MAG: NAD-dependent epimerase/dehydratase family protein, partial [Chloroflexota bacterium]